MAMTEKRSQSLIEQYIEQNPHRPGLDEARLVGYGVAVWALVGYLRGAQGDILRVADDYDIPVEAVEAAIAYYHEHQILIDARRAANRVIDAA
ncbi:MAG: DUF433 domain-containing protein [Thermomicrobiales bacterium]